MIELVIFAFDKFGGGTICFSSPWSALSTAELSTRRSTFCLISIPHHTPAPLQMHTSRSCYNNFISSYLNCSQGICLSVYCKEDMCAKREYQLSWPPKRRARWGRPRHRPGCGSGSAKEPPRNCCTSQVLRKSQSALKLSEHIPRSPLGMRKNDQDSCLFPLPFLPCWAGTGQAIYAPFFFSFFSVVNLPGLKIQYLAFDWFYTCQVEAYL